MSDATSPGVSAASLRHRVVKEKEQQAASKRAQAGLPPLKRRANPVLSALKWLLLAVVLSGALSRSATGTWLWGYQGKYSSLANIWEAIIPTPEAYFTEKQLARHDGSDPKYPVYVAIDGDVYDVSSSAKTYGPGGGYHVFAGKDAARAFITGCFQTHLTHDLRGISAKDLESLAHWKEFFSGHATYKKVGRVGHPPIDPSSPIPEDCNAKKKDGA